MSPKSKKRATPRVAVPRRMIPMRIRVTMTRMTMEIRREMTFGTETMRQFCWMQTNSLARCPRLEETMRTPRKWSNPLARNGRLCDECSNEQSLNGECNGSSRDATPSPSKHYSTFSNCECRTIALGTPQITSKSIAQVQVQLALQNPSRKNPTDFVENAVPLRIVECATEEKHLKEEMKKQEAKEKTRRQKEDNQNEVKKSKEREMKDP